MIFVRSVFWALVLLLKSFIKASINTSTIPSFGDRWAERHKAVFFALPNPHPPTGGRIFCSPEQSKLCFEMLEINSAPQNHLPLQGAENRSEVAVYSN